MAGVTDTLDKALEILNKEIDKLYTKSQAEALLDRSEASNLTDYIKTLVAIRKDDREAAKADPMSTKSDEDLMTMAKEALDYLNGLESSKKQEEDKDAKPDDTKPSEAPPAQTT